MTRREKLNAVVASLLATAFLLALALAASPQLHARVHPDAGSLDHECAATLVASGNYELTATPPVLLPPQPAQFFAVVPEFATIWVPALFSRAAVFEHAPPVLS